MRHNITLATVSAVLAFCGSALALSTMVEDATITPMISTTTTVKVWNIMSLPSELSDLFDDLADLATHWDSYKHVYTSEHPHILGTGTEEQAPDETFVNTTTPRSKDQLADIGAAISKIAETGTYWNETATATATGNGTSTGHVGTGTTIPATTVAESFTTTDIQTNYTPVATNYEVETITNYEIVYLSDAAIPMSLPRKLSRLAEDLANLETQWDSYKKAPTGTEQKGLVETSANATPDAADKFEEIGDVIAKIAANTPFVAAVPNPSPRRFVPGVVTGTTTPWAVYMNETATAKGTGTGTGLITAPTITITQSFATSEVEVSHSPAASSELETITQYLVIATVMADELPSSTSDTWSDVTLTVTETATNAIEARGWKFPEFNATSSTHHSATDVVTITEMTTVVPSPSTATVLVEVVVETEVVSVTADPVYVSSYVFPDAMATASVERSRKPIISIGAHLLSEGMVGSAATNGAWENVVTSFSTSVIPTGVVVASGEGGSIGKGEEDFTAA